MKKKIRKTLVKDKIKNIIDGVNIVAENLPDNFGDFINSGLIKDGIYKKIEFSIENILDISNIINSDLDLGTPETEDSIIEHLEINKIFDKKIINLISEMKRFRNILIHKYGEINDEQAFETIKTGLGDFELIIEEIERVLRKYS
jgi:uncharacterized protein YutE (UPF0331/DUF86 family)